MPEKEWYEQQMRIAHPSLGRRPGTIQTLDMAQVAATVAGQNYNTQHLRYSDTYDGEQRIFLFQTEEAKHIPRDVLGDYLPEAHKRGIKVFIYVNVHKMDRGLIDEQPRWNQQRADGSHLTGLYGGDIGSPCVNTGYRPWITGLIEEFAANYAVDGVFLDGPCFYVGTCYCPDCQTQFRDRYGLDIRDIGSEDDPHWPEFIEFRYDSIASFVGACREALQQHKPGAPLYMNANGLHSGRWNGRHNRKLIKAQDILGAEGGFIFYGRPLDVPLWKVSGTAKFLEAQAEGKPTVIFTAAGHKPWAYPLTEPEIRLNVAATFANGSNPWVGASYENLDDPSMASVADELAFFARHEKALSDTVGMGETVLLWSHATADYYGTHMPEIDFVVDRPDAKEHFDYQSAFQGAYEALLRSGTPFRIIDDVGIREEEALADVKTLILPDVACMAEDTADGIRTFVRDGGTLVATNNTSLYDEVGQPRDDFLLGDVLGATYVEPRGISQWDLVYLTEDAGDLLGFERTDIPSPTYQIRVQANSETQMLARYHEPMGNRYAPRPDPSPDPAILYQEYGQGRCLYLAGDAAHHYWTYRIAEYQQLLTHGVLEAPHLVLEAPSSAVEVTYQDKQDGSGCNIHLLNYTGEMERPIKRIVELDDCVLHLRQDRDPTDVRALRAGQDISWLRKGELLHIPLPTLSHHEVIHIDWD